MRLNIQFKNKKILITGATGFVGGRLAERLVLEHGADVCCLVRNFSKASRLGRLQVRMLAGDLLDRSSILEAGKDCDYIFHCAVGFEGSEKKQRRVNIDGNRFIVEAAASAKARVVHISTVMVYGSPPDGDLDESCERQPEADVYSQSKFEGENTLLESGRALGVSATVLQPAIIYGPYAFAWTTNVLAQIRRKRVILVNDGNGLCNAVYVDDLINGMLLAATKEQAIGETFLISGAQPVTWQEFYEQFENILGYDSHVSMTDAEAKKLFSMKRSRRGLLKETLSILREEDPVRWRVRDTREIDTLVKMGKSILPKPLIKSLANRVKQKNGQEAKPAEDTAERAIQLLGPASIDFFASKVSVRIDKARKLLGYDPVFDLIKGMELTGKWAQWANLI